MPKTVKKPKKLPNAPKKPATTYLSYLSYIRKTHVSELEKMSQQEQREFLNEKWQSIDASEKEKYEKEYEEKIAQYRKKYEEYKNSDMYIQDCKDAGIRPKIKRRPKSAYNLFVASEYPKMKGSFAECTSELSKKWKQMNDQDKEQWKRMAEEEKAKFAVQKED